MQPDLGCNAEMKQHLILKKDNETNYRKNTDGFIHHLPAAFVIYFVTV